MAVIERSIFNGETFDSFSPNVTKEYNSKVITTLIVLGIAVTVGVIVYQEVVQRKREKLKAL
jgi:hypothetical protein